MIGSQQSRRWQTRILANGMGRKDARSASLDLLPEITGGVR